MALVDEDSAQVRFPPPLIVFGCLMLGLGLGELLELPHIDSALLRPLGFVIGAVGAAIIGSGILGFVRAGNNPEPWKRDTAFVTSGLYRFTRNPMYLGMVLVQLGIACAALSIGGLLSVPVAMLLVARFVIAREERHLRATFGDEYRAYCERVRRWI